MEKKQGRIGIFGGTLEGRLLAEFCQKHEIPAVVSVATAYGSRLLKQEKELLVTAGRMKEKKMQEWMKKNQVTAVIDATHPFAREVTQEIQNACTAAKIPYFRLIRETGERGDRKTAENEEEIVFVNSVQKAADWLEQELFLHPDRKALIATGSKELSCFSRIQDAKNRLYVRVLPSLEAVRACLDAGFFGRHIMAMQGPFSYELNCAWIREVQASYLVTKESGRIGGFEEKMAAAKDCGCQLIVVGRPMEEEGKSLEEIKKWLLSR